MMKADFFYTNWLGRWILNIVQKLGFFKIVAWFLHTRLSKTMISKYIQNNHIDMSDYPNQQYDTFAQFFSRTKKVNIKNTESNVLISPCDSYLSAYEIQNDLELPMKGSLYRLNDLVPNKNLCELFDQGLCLVFRLEASDYHHFHCFDDMWMEEAHYIPGMLHSVQPIALDSIPVFRLNRRWWSVLETKNFGKVAQIEIGAMAVGGVSFEKEKGWFNRGDEMGKFELAGSTIVLLFNKEIKENLHLLVPVKDEYKVRLGEGIGVFEKNE